MTDQLRQAAQQALEALEGLFGLPNQWESGGVAVWRLGGSDAPRQAITALRTALEQQAEPVALAHSRHAKLMAKFTENAEAMKALAQAEPASGCACRWNHKDDRVATCERHQGWLEVIAEWADRAREAEAKLKAAQPEWLLIKNILDEYGLQAIDFVAEFKAAQQVATIWKQQKQQAPFSPEVINTAQTAWKMGYEAAKAEQQAEPTCPDCKAAVLFECVACSSNNYPPKQQAEPPQRQWVGLEIEEVQDSYNSDYQAQTRAVEKLLKERNT